MRGAGAALGVRISATSGAGCDAGAGCALEREEVESNAKPQAAAAKTTEHRAFFFMWKGS